MRPASEQWEYKVVFINNDHIEDVLDNHGARGWEAWWMDGFSPTCMRMFFKRRRA